jgi:prepilin-type N-terminal cleavage/methylation domain-containing protein
MTETLKRKKGFTLTELIVVIAIIGILAAVLVPSLGGYIKKARQNSDLQEAAIVGEIYENWKLSGENLPTDENDATTQFLAYYLSLETGQDLVEDVDFVLEGVAVGNIFGTGFKLKGNNGYIVTYVSEGKVYTVGNDADEVLIVTEP